ncbi:MAG: Flp family type IVb pilin, partial [bacterium]|nr:Flp family type IVb pilin [bacterium]
MLALIIVVAIAAVSSLGTKVSQIFSAVDGTMTVPGGS